MSWLRHTVGMTAEIAPLPCPVPEVVADGLRALMRDAIEGGASIGFLADVAEGELAEYWAGVLSAHAAGSKVVLVARDQAGRVAGSVQLALETRPNGRHRAEVQKLMVLREARRSGLGRRLMTAIEAEARARGVRLLFLDTSEGVAGACEFYERCGYAYVGGIPGYALDPDGTPSRNAIYCRQLPAQACPQASKAGLGSGPDMGASCLRVVPMGREHWDAVKVIYQEGIDTGHSTFQESAQASHEEFLAGKAANSALVAVDEAGRCLGWSVLSPVSGRAVYAGVMEVSIYVAAASRGLGVGRRLLAETISWAERNGIWTLQSGTFPENTASLRMQQEQGFRVVGVRRRMARMRHGPWAGRWRDVVLLERRSTTSGC